MFELLLCSMFTILPDFLFRRYVQGKRIGREITLYSVWFELRWGIVLCVLLTVSLITLIFYFHPSTKSAITMFRTVPILSEYSGRVAEIYVDMRQDVRAGDPIFKLDSSAQEAAVETARRRVIEIDAQTTLAKNQLAASEARIQEADSAYQGALRELERQKELKERAPTAVADRTIDLLDTEAAGRKGALLQATAERDGILTEISTLLPSQKASVEAALHEAEIDLAKTVVKAGVDGSVEQFALRVGDIVNPFLRPAGILVPSEAGRQAILAGFGQIEAQVMKVGMIAEATCVAKPFTIIPLVVAEIQDVIAAGQVLQTDRLLEPQEIEQQGLFTVFLEPLFEGGLDDIPPGSSCIANAYTSNYDKLESADLSITEFLFLHVVDTVGLVHAMILRIQALLLPVQTLVLTDH